MLTAHENVIQTNNNIAQQHTNTKARQYNNTDLRNTSDQIFTALQLYKYTTTTIIMIITTHQHPHRNNNNTSTQPHHNNTTQQPKKQNIIRFLNIWSWKRITNGSNNNDEEDDYDADDEEDDYDADDEEDDYDADDVALLVLPYVAASIFLFNFNCYKHFKDVRTTNI
ncbi:hypothetical protein HELRODRAFT_168199 [Helobdella robusta]|uniref:Uncharacterized protein n=1 Tax=Helobdella robusta TaxID=6412 RepID=T1F0A8_HELRO|nr:hypothetical protein HELRODRAFT_168199 [Helobdella robusta]ESO09237.1 hypothetical protein HELRODRAFT_168199 [Helobdella robusta]